MKKIIDASKWLIRHFFYFSIAVFIVIYLRWFRLTPLMFYNDPDYAYIVGLILLGLYCLFAILIKLSESKTWLKILLLIPAIFFFMGIVIHAYAFFPSVETIAKCNKKTYYITWMHPFGDYQWTFDNITIWKSVFKYESFFFGYSGGPYEIVCDKELDEANIISAMNDMLVLVYTDGKNPRNYDRYTGAILGDHRYFLADQCNDWVPSTCGSDTYTLYQCNLEIKSCKPLSLQYTTPNTESFVFETDEKANQISLYDDFDYNPNRTLIFTYGEYPRCYVEGCEILK